MRPFRLSLVLMLGLVGCGAGDQRARIEAANAAAERGDYRSAELELLAALNKKPHDAASWLRIAAVQFQLGNFKSAEDALLRGAGGPPSAGTAILRVRIDLGQGQPATALRDVADPSIPVLEQEVLRGHTYAQLHRFPEEEQAYRRALALDAACFEAQLGVVEALLHQSQTDQAAQQLDQIEARHPRRAEVYRLRALLLARTGKPEQVEMALAMAARYLTGQLDRPTAAEVLASLADSQLQLGHLEAAQKTAEQLELIAPAIPVTQLLGGRLALARGDYADATRRLRTLVDQVPSLTQAHEVLGRSLMMQGNPEAGGREFAALLKTDPGNVEARKLLAVTQMQMGQYETVKQTLAPLSTASPADPGTASPADPAAERLMAAAELHLGEESAALALLQHSADSHVQDLTAQLELISAYLSMSMDSQADLRIQQVTAAHRDDVATLNALGAFLMKSGEFARADAALNEALTVNPKSLATRFLQAELAVARGNLTAARERYLQIRQLEGDSVAARMALAQLDLSLDRRQEAAQILAAIPAVGAGGAAIQDRIGQLWLDATHFEEARPCFIAATEAAPGNAAYWANLGAAELGLGHLDAANKAVSQSLRLDPESIAAKRVQVYLRLREKRPDEALRMVQSSAVEQPFNTAAWELAGDAYGAVKDYRKALFNYESASRVAPSGRLALKSYQAVRADGGAQALDPLLHWLKRHPGDSLVRRALAQAYESGGEPGEAIKHYEILIGKGSEEAGVFNNLALLYLRQGDARALSMAHRAYELAPASASVADTYGWALVETGQLNEGLKLLQTAAGTPEASGDTRFHYAAALSRSGAREQARNLLTSLLASNARLSDRTQAQHLLQQL